jgi:hypothetical protein
LKGIEHQDCKAAHRLGHEFKRSGESYGFPEIARTGAAIELAALTADEHEIRNQIVALATYLERVRVSA